MIPDWPADPADVLIGSLFSGYGGLEMGVQLALGGRAIWHCEYDKAPSAILAHHWPAVPNLGDITKVDWSTVPRVHVMTGGSPCQDVSTAGRRKGMKDGTRSGLWAAMVDAIEALRPPIVVWENVRGVTSAEATSDVELCAGCVGDDSGVYLRALGRVLGDLADLGYDAVWHGLLAADVGAPHGRFRIFVVAVDGHANGADRAQPFGELHQRRADAERTDCRGAAAADGPAAANAADGRQGRRGKRDRGRAAGRGAAGQPHAHGDGTAANANGDDRGQQEHGSPSELRARELLLGSAAPARRGRGRDATAAAFATAQEAGIDFGEFTVAVRRWELILGRPAPAPVEMSAPTAMYPDGRWTLSPWFAEWMMGLPEGHLADPAIDLGLEPGSPGDRGARLKAAGNGVVPQQAAAAIRVCLARWAAAHPRLVEPTVAEAPSTCRACDQVKPVDEFGWNVHGQKRTVRGVCKACRRAGRKATTHTTRETA